MFGTMIFGITPFATYGEELPEGLPWKDQCPFTTIWTNQLKRASNSQRCGG